jgi:hypothetical protein
MQIYHVIVIDDRVNVPLRYIVSAPDEATACTYATARACVDAGLPFSACPPFSVLEVEMAKPEYLRVV